MSRFAFYGRVSTEDNQDENASRGWQLRRGREIIEPGGGVIVAEFFDVGQSRSLPWRRRPEADRLLTALADPNRGFEAIVIGEPARAFYGNQFSLIFPVIDHYGVELWVPEVGGRVDPGSEAHEMVMTLFGGMSKGERNRVKMRVRATMADMTEREGRFLGGRPPYGYRLFDVGLHPKPDKASMGVQLHQLEPDPVTAPVVKRIFTMYLGGAGLRTIAETLVAEGIPSPSAHDPARNGHRTGVGWAHSAVRAILTNPRYTGQQVWGRQPRRETLLDPSNPAEGYKTAQAWADTSDWVRSASPSHDRLVDDETFEEVRTLLAAKGADHKRTARSPKKNSPYVFAGMVVCGVCGRKMAGHRAHERLGYRCRLRDQYALPDSSHPKSLFVSEDGLMIVATDWLSGLTGAEHRDQVLNELLAVAGEPSPNIERAAAELRQAEQGIDNVVNAISKGALEPEEAKGKLAHLRAQRDAARAVLASSDRLTKPLTAELVSAGLDRVGGLVAAMDVAGASADEKAAVYKAADLGIIYHPDRRAVTLRACVVPRGVSVRVGGGTCTLTPPLVLTADRLLPAA